MKLNLLTITAHLYIKVILNMEIHQFILDQLQAVLAQFNIVMNF